MLAGSVIEPFLEPGTSRSIGLNPDRIGAAVPGYLPSSLIMRRSMLDRVGLFDPTLWSANDTDWFVRAGTLGFEALVVPEVLVRYRIHESNQSSNISAGQKSLLQMIRMNIVRRRKLGNPQDRA